MFCLYLFRLAIHFDWLEWCSLASRRGPIWRSMSNRLLILCSPTIATKKLKKWRKKWMWALIVKNCTKNGTFLFAPVLTHGIYMKTQSVCFFPILLFLPIAFNSFPVLYSPSFSCLVSFFALFTSAFSFFFSALFSVRCDSNLSTIHLRAIHKLFIWMAQE